MAANVESAMYYKVPAWHGLGVVLDNPPSSWDALVQSNLNWDVVQESAYRKNGQIVDNLFLNVRETDNSILGSVTGRYRIVQNREAFAFLDELLKNDDSVTFESAGSLAMGRRVWILAHLPKSKILGEEFVPYIVFANSHDGSQALTVAMTPTRVVCQNTLTAALNNAKRSWSIRHTGNISGRQADAATTLKLSYKYMDCLTNQAEHYQQKAIGYDDFNQILESVFPLPVETPEKVLTERVKRNVAELRKNVADIYNTVPDLKKFKGTAWGVYNAFTDFVSHTKPLRETKTYQEKLFSSFIDGNKVLEKAQAAIEAA